MKRRFSHTDHEMPELNTSSLPDLIFTVLFFFMLVTHMREVDLKVNYTLPQGTEVRKLGHKSAIIQIYIGKQGDDGDYAIQLNNKIATLDDVKDFIANERSQMSEEDQQHMTVSIRADRDVPMGIIADVKQELQKAFALRINYSASERVERGEWRDERGER